MEKRKSIERHYNKWGYIFIIPFLIAFILFQLWPMINTFYFAFCDMKHCDYSETPKTLMSLGLPWYKNFADLFDTNTFVISVKNTFFFWIWQTIPEWILAFWLAAMMTDRRLKIRGRSFFKTAFFFPQVMIGTTVGSNIIWLFLGFAASSTAFSLTAAAINGFGVTEKDFEFFMSSRFMIIVVGAFLHYGITFIYAVVGMTSIPVEIFEAAEIDGSSRLHTFFHVTLPCMRPILFFIVVISVVDGLTDDYAASMLGNQYDTARRTVTMREYLDKVVGFGSAYDRGSAFCLILLAMSAIISGLIYFFLIRDRYEAKLAREIRKEKRMERRLKAGKAN